MIACKLSIRLISKINGNKKNEQTIMKQSVETVPWNNAKPKISDHVNVVGPPQNHNGYVVYQDGKIIGPRYRYYETASENAGCGSVTSFDLAVRENWI